MTTNTRGFAMFLAACCLSATLCVGTRGVAQELGQDSRFNKRALTGKELSDITLAVEDEIYDFSQQRSFFRRGHVAKGEKLRHLDLFINPHLSGEGDGQLIYDNLPYGEVVRFFYIQNDGTISLKGGRGVGYPATQPSHLTIFEDKDDLRRSKSRWIHRRFTIYRHPDGQMLRSAGNRQLKRRGYSHYLQIVTDHAILP